MARMPRASRAWPIRVLMSSDVAPSLPRPRRPWAGFLLGLQNLPALVHAGFQIEVVRTAQFAGILVLGIGRLLQGIRRAAHATPRGRWFSSGNGHVRGIEGAVGGMVRGGRLKRFGRELKCR